MSARGASSAAAPATTPRPSRTPRGRAGCAARCSCPRRRRSPRSRRRRRSAPTCGMVGATVDEALAAAHERAARGRRDRVRPPVRRPGRDRRPGRVGLELLEQVPDLARVIVPVGGGGLVSGIAIALKSVRPAIEVIGVQVAGVRAGAGIAGGGQAGPRRLGADDRRRDRGQAPGRADAGADRPLGRRDGRRRRGRGRRGDGVPARAGEARGRGRRRGRRGGAARPAAGRRAPGTTVVVLSGGNVDAGLLAEVARRHESQAGGGSCCWPRCPTGLARSRGCWRWSASCARTCSTSSTSARGSTSTSARPRSSWCSRRAAPTTRSRSPTRSAQAGYAEPRPLR